MERRTFLKNGWKLGGGLMGLAAVWTSWEALRPLRAGGTGGKLKLKDLANYEPGSAEYLVAGRLWVVNPGDGKVLALSQKCPHLGCRVPFCESSGRFECPCHGSTYNLAGEWIKGPAPRGMDRYAVVQDDSGASYVDTTKLTQGPAHGSNEYPNDARGPACTGA